MLPPPRDSIPLIRDLNRKYVDATVHYAGVASNIDVNGSDLVPPPPTMPRRKVYCTFDTGCSGMAVGTSLHDARYDSRANHEESLWGMRGGFGQHCHVARGASHHHTLEERRSAMGEIAGREWESGIGGNLRRGRDEGGYRWGGSEYTLFPTYRVIVGMSP